MTAGFLFKILIFALLIAILLSLSGGLFFLAKDRGRSRRTIYSLTVRVILSVTLFLLLLTGYVTGLLRPHSLLPAETQTSPAVPAPRG
jgi:hypothetical protein